jgi:hypothetical protein
LGFHFEFMKKLIAVGLIILVLLGVVIALEVFASESGEVIVISTEDKDSTALRTRLWVVDHEGEAWLRAGSPKSGWYLRLIANPSLNAIRGAETFPASAQIHPEMSGEINRLMNDKYGWADDYIGMLFGRDKAVAIRLVRGSESQ